MASNKEGNGSILVVTNNVSEEEAHKLKASIGESGRPVVLLHVMPNVPDHFHLLPSISHGMAQNYDAQSQRLQQLSENLGTTEQYIRLGTNPQREALRLAKDLGIDTVIVKTAQQSQAGWLSALSQRKEAQIYSLESFVRRDITVAPPPPSQLKHLKNKRDEQAATESWLQQKKSPPVRNDEPWQAARTRRKESTPSPEQSTVVSSNTPTPHNTKP